jgi:hypothetical protein
MAQGGKRKQPPERRELPPPLPPETRTVGQLIGEAVRTYQHRFWRSLALGVLPAVVGITGAAVSFSRPGAIAFTLAAGTPVFTLSYVCACGLVLGVPVRTRAGVGAFAAGSLVFLVGVLLAYVFVLPGLVWLAFFGFAVPVALVEDVSFWSSFSRSTRLGRADFAHALGGLCALVIVVVLSQGVVFLLLRSFAETARVTSGFLAAVVLSPLLFLGSAILYGDQAARIRSGKPRSRRRDAHVPDADNAHREGRADAQVEPGPSA